MGPKSDLPGREILVVPGTGVLTEKNFFFFIGECIKI